MKVNENLKNIVILVDCLSKGGAEKSAAILSGLLHDRGYGIYIITLRNEVDYDYKGKLITLSATSSGIKILNQFKKVLQLRHHIKTINPNYIIDFRMRHEMLREYVMHRLIFDYHKMVFTIHNYFVDYHLPKGKFFKNRYNKQLVTAVSKDIKKILENNYGINKVNYLPNPIDAANIENMANLVSIKESYIVAVGRLRNSVKQFDKLINVYAESELPKQNIKLKILGDGPDRTELHTLVKALDLEPYVELLGFKKNPYPYIKNAKYLVLCSKHEGLPMVILEALTLKTPVVSFNCKSGPSEMIKHNYNGILIENQNFQALKDSMVSLIYNKDKLRKLQANADTLLDNYSQKVHMERWQKLLV